jgi:preprotein translocase subunit SecE
VFQVYKRGQGKYTRLATFAVGGVIGAAVAYYVSDYLSATRLSQYAVFGIPLAIFVAIGVLMFWLVNRPRTADFMIATEGEMKKVSWSSKKEIIGGTKVVIATTLILAMMLLTVDLACGLFFRWIGVLQTGGA